VDGRPVPRILCAYHPSRQNTNTGKLTEEMLDSILAQARRLSEHD
jgi:uracil-DNA glycosylase